MQANRSMTGTLLAAALLATGLGAWLAGCTSDLPNRVGSGLVDDELDQSLIQLLADDVTAYGALTVDDPAVPLHRQQVLYLGRQQGVRSRILVNYDFSDVYSDSFPASAFTAANIKSVKLGLVKLLHYEGSEITGQPVELFYGLRQLSAPFDSTLFRVAAGAGAIPGVVAGELNVSPTVSITFAKPEIPLDEEVALGWFQGAQTLGFVIELNDNSDEGLVGFSSSEFLRYSEVDSTLAGLFLPPKLIVEFEDRPESESFRLSPVADTSTFEDVPDAPADLSAGFVLRTCLRSYPVLDFDFSGLPSDALINRAVLRVACDTTLTFGHAESIVVAEIDSTVLASDGQTLTLAELATATSIITGQTSLYPSDVFQLAFDVTSAVQRIVNGVYDDPRAFVLAAGEDAYSTYDLTSVDPDFYFTEFRFHGTSAVDSLRPRLEITYSRRDERLGGAE
ncbi:MAG: hypothetical protein IPK64_11520 [bacterium]|nr:hypothetical protein [bacterium]